MKNSIVIASLVAAFALTACGKKEEPVVVVPAPVVAPAVVEPAPAPVEPAAAPAADASASTTTPTAVFGGTAAPMPEAGDAKNQADEAAAKAAADAAAAAATPAK